MANINNFIEWIIYINMQVRSLVEKAANFSEDVLNLQVVGGTIEQPDELRIELNIGDNELIREM